MMEKNISANLNAKQTAGNIGDSFFEAAEERQPWLEQPGPDDELRHQPEIPAQACLTAPV